MSDSVAAVILLQLVLAFVGLLIFAAVKAIWKKIDTYIDQWEGKKRQAAMIDEEKKKQAAIAEFRKRHPVQIVGAPNSNLFKQILERLDEFISTVKSTPPIEPFFLRQNTDDDGPDPAPWQTILDSLAIQPGQSLQAIYDDLGVAKPPLQLPLMSLPSWSIKIIESETGSEIDPSSDNLAEIYAPEIEQANTLRGTADQWKKLIEKRLEESKQVEEYAARELEPIRRIYYACLLETKEGIEQHFSLGLQTLVLPIPPRFPWRVFYAPEERLIQINQRVPFTSDIVVKRTESKRPLAKRDIEYFLRRLIPAISLHIAANVAANDWRNHIDAIAVNCWSRYFEKTTGKLKDAFVSSVKIEKQTILEMNLVKVEPLDAFRALRGVFVYSTEDIVPIEPQIRLDKNDARFVAGKDILDGMAQGQNLATMDWQDFEHLIRELLAKEYGKDGSDVRITRASRDRGVDAVVFDPDPLHGGKYVVQAKRYNNICDVSAVRDLYGTMLNEGASRGILVTTSRYGRDAFDFASNKPITLIDGQNLLALLAKHGYQFRIELV
jgi:restriction system protein